MSKKNSGGTEQPLTRRQLRELEDARQAKQSADSPPVSSSPGNSEPAPATSRKAARRPGPATATPDPTTPSTADLAGNTPARRTTKSDHGPAESDPAAPSSGVGSISAAGPNRVSAATLRANGTGPTSEQARRAPASAALPTNLRFAPDVFSPQSRGGAGDSRITRRSIHQVKQDAAADQTPAVPAVVPPSQTSAIRRIDETGEISTITASGQTISEKDVATTITRKSIWADRDVESSSGEAPTASPSAVAPVTPIAPEISESERLAAAALDTATMMALVDVENPVTPVPDATPALEPEPVLGSDPAELALPNWSAITALDSDMSTDALPSSGHAFDDSSITPVSLDLGQVDAITDQEEPVVEIDHSYTWLHYLILIAIAAVLGMVVWKIALNPSNDEPTNQETQTMRYSVSQMLI